MNDSLPSIPSSWVWTTADDLIDGIDSGKSFKCEERPPEAGEVGIVKVSAVTWGTYNEAESKTCTRPEMVDDDKFIRQGDFLFSRANTIDLVGACVIADSVSKQVMLSDKILRFDVRPGWDRWLMWLLRCGHGRDEIQSLATGNQDSMRNIGQARIRQIRVPLAPFPEQRRIVEAVESYFTRLDAAVATLERVRANLRRYRASVLKAAVEGRLVPTEAELARAQGRGYEPASALLERILEERRRRWQESGGRGRYKEPVAVAADTDGLTELPEGWCWATVEQLTLVGTGATPKRGDPRFWHDGDVPWVTSRVVNGRYVNEASEFVTEVALAETNLTLYPSGTLLIAMYGEGKTRGMCAVTRFPTTTNQAIASLVTTPLPTESVEWLRTFMDNNYTTVRRRASGGVQPNLNLGIIKAIAVPLPPLAEQSRAVAEVERRLSLLEAQERTVERNIFRCSRLRQSILKWAFEGKLADQDPDDEPASVLLERIRAERDTMTPKKAARRGRPRGRA